MYDGGKIGVGLVIFLGGVTFPIWYSAAAGDTWQRPEPALPEKATECVESRAYMKASHMDLLDRWRDEVVREGQRTYTASDGKTWDRSLSRTCMQEGCHANKQQFCDECHIPLGVTHSWLVDELECWECHVAPEGRK